MDLALIRDLEESNPWLCQENQVVVQDIEYIQRSQESFLMDPEWDEYWTLLIGPRRAGKTTLGKHLSAELIKQQRVDQLLYINCDYSSVREYLNSSPVLSELLSTFQLQTPVLFIDEVQRIENPGILLKRIIDLNLKIKLIASGSSQLEMKSKVQEFLTGREIESIVLPLSRNEIQNKIPLEMQLIFGSYPKIIYSQHKQMLLAQLYSRYIQKDIIEILRLQKPDILEKLITLVAHSSGQLINYQQLANDCKVTVPTIQSYLVILEQTYVIAAIKPFVGNKRTEITSNPIYYFLDNGFRNQALRNFNDLSLRNDTGLLVEGFVFQELIKFKTQNFHDFDIHYWRTKAGAEVDFVVYKNIENFLPIEVKYREIKKPSISRGFRSFLQAYKPKLGIYITKSLIASAVFEDTEVHFIPLAKLEQLFPIIKKSFCL